MDKKRNTKWIDWLLGPDIELLINKKTRISSVGCLIGFLGLLVYWDYFNNSSPWFWLPIGFSVLLLISGIRLYFNMDELLQRIFQDSALITLVVVCGTILLIRPWLDSYFSFVTIDFFIASIASVFGLAVFVYYRFKL